MFINKLISIFLLIMLNESCIKKSSSHISSVQENKKYDFYLYGLNLDKNIICQYKCKNDSKSIEDSCDKYYAKLDSSQLDDTTRELIQNPKLFQGFTYNHSFEKTFKIKNLETLSNLETNKDTEHFCNFEYFLDGRYLWIPSNNKFFYYPEKPLLFSITEEGKNNIWSKCSVSYFYDDKDSPITSDMYCEKNKKDGYLILSINTISDSSSIKSSPEYKFFDFVSWVQVKQNFLKEHNILNNTEYLGLTRNDILITNFGTLDGVGEQFSLVYGDLVMVDSPLSHSNTNTLKVLHYINTFMENEDLYFIEGRYHWWKKVKIMEILTY